jgi:hypothetical protein
VASPTGAGTVGRAGTATGAGTAIPGGLTGGSATASAGGTAARGTTASGTTADDGSASDGSASDGSADAGTRAPSAAERGGLTALAAALRSMTAARPIVSVAGGSPVEGKTSRSPSGRPLVMLCLWATLLGLVGLGIGVRGLVVIIANHPASWFKPTLIISGLGGILLTACGFVTARRGILPWVFLGAATAILIISVVFSAAV